MSKELDEFYKSYSARLIAVDDTPLVEVMDGGKFKLLSIEEYEEMANKIADLEAKLAECEKSKESYRLQNEQHHLQLLQFYSRLGVEAFGADIHEKALETLMIMKEELVEKKGLERALSACNRQNDEFADMIKKLVNEKEELKQLAITEKALELACEPRDDWGGEKYSGTEYDNYYDYFMAEAKEMLGNEKRR